VCEGGLSSTALGVDSMATNADQGNKTRGSIKGVDYFGQLRGCYFLVNDSVPSIGLLVSHLIETCPSLSTFHIQLI
jgi:hypothetical protein